MSSLDDYAAAINVQLNGQNATTPLVKEGESSFQTSNALKPIHLQQRVFTIPISWNGTLQDFQNGKVNWEVSSKMKHNLAQLSEGGYVVDSATGQKYRAILASADVTSVKNSSPLEVGIKLDGVPTKSSVLLPEGGTVESVDIIIPPDVHTPIVQNKTLHVNTWDATGIQNLVKQGWGTFTEKNIRDSILEKDKVGWKLTETSPIVGYGIQQKAINKANLIKVQNQNNTAVSNSGYTGNVFAIEASLGQKLYDALLKEMKNTPFHDPLKVKAKLVRMDGKDWVDSKVGIGASVNHPTMTTTTPEHISAHLDLTCQLWEIK